MAESRSQEAARGVGTKGAPWVAIVVIAWASSIAALQLQWGGFEYVPTLAAMSASDEMFSEMLLRGWLSGSLMHAAWGLVGCAVAIVQMERMLGRGVATLLVTTTMVLAGGVMAWTEGLCGPAAVACVWSGAYASSHWIQGRRAFARWHSLPAGVCAVAAAGALMSPGASIPGLVILLATGLALGWKWSRPASAALSPGVQHRVQGLMGGALVVGTLVAFGSGMARHHPWALVEPVELETHGLVVEQAGVGLSPDDDTNPGFVISVELPVGLEGPQDYTHTMNVEEGETSWTFRLAQETDVLFGVGLRAMVFGVPPRTAPIWVHVWGGAGLDCEEPIMPRFDARPVDGPRAQLRDLNYVSELGILVRTRTIQSPFGCAHLAVYSWSSAPDAQKDAVDRITASFQAGAQRAERLGPP